MQYRLREVCNYYNHSDNNLINLNNFDTVLYLWRLLFGQVRVW
ncbi:MAG: hypothetical protein QXE33_03320 [Candidatus Micrarchaeaceae archaeon]